MFFASNSVFFHQLQLASHDILWPALMAVWSKALPLTASCHSPLSGFKSHPEYVRMLPVRLWIRRWFSPVTLVSSTSYNWLVMTSPQYGRNNDKKNEIPNLKFPYIYLIELKILKKVSMKALYTKVMTLQ